MKQYKLKPIKESLAVRYGYPETLSAREAYAIAWHIARSAMYRKNVIGLHRSWNIYKQSYTAFGIPTDLACLTRKQLYQRNQQEV